MPPKMSVFSVILLCSLTWGNRYTEAAKFKPPPAAYVFGDSILDTGNRAAMEPGTSPSRLPPYGRDFIDGIATGRYSNGRLMVDFLAQYMKLKDLSTPIAVIEKRQSLDRMAVSSINFAYAGSGFLNTTGTPGTSLGAQVEQFRSVVVPALREKLNSNTSATNLHLARSIVYLATGNNDIAAPFDLGELLYRGSKSTEDLGAFITATVGLLLDVLSAQIQSLYDVGMRRFILPQLMAIGCSPPFGEACVAPVDQFVMAFNEGLEDLLEDLFHRSTGGQDGRPKLYGAVVMHPKLYDLSLDIASNPAKYEYQGKGPCVQTSPVDHTITSVCDNADSFIWFDDYHPSQKFYRTMAHRMWYEDEKHGLPWMPKNGTEFLRKTFRYKSGKNH